MSTKAACLVVCLLLVMFLGEFDEVRSACHLEKLGSCAPAIKKPYPKPTKPCCDAINAASHDCLCMWQKNNIGSKAQTPRAMAIYKNCTGTVLKCPGKMFP
ncbi:hypothetical protein OROGR_010289 [Orobanche gracilis]